MSKEVAIFVTGAVVGLAGNLIVSLVNHLLALRRDKIFRERKQQEERMIKPATAEELMKDIIAMESINIVKAERMVTGEEIEIEIGKMGRYYRPVYMSLAIVVALLLIMAIVVAVILFIPRSVLMAIVGIVLGVITPWAIIRGIRAITK